MHETGSSPDLPRGDSASMARDHLRWYIGIVHKGEPPVGVHEEGRSPLEVCLLRPKVVIKPVVRRDLVECAKTSLCTTRRTVEKGLDEGLLVGVGGGEGGPAAVLVCEEERLDGAEIAVERPRNVWHGQTRQRHHRPKHTTARDQSRSLHARSSARLCVDRAKLPETSHRPGQSAFFLYSTSQHAARNGSQTARTGSPPSSVSTQSGTLTSSSSTSRHSSYSLISPTRRCPDPESILFSSLPTHPVHPTPGAQPAQPHARKGRLARHPYSSK